MPNEGGFVGGVSLPLAEGAHKDAITDPVVDALAALAAFWLNRDLNDKLARLPGTSNVAVETKNVFSYSPLEPRGHMVKLPVPSLFVWWDGKSQWSPQTSLYHVRTREVHMLYAMEELSQKMEMERRTGLVNAVDASMFAMSHRQVSDAHNGGVWINETLADLNLLSWEWMGGKPGRFGIDEGPLAERRAAKRSGRDYPALIGSWSVAERVELVTNESPGDELGDAVMTIKGNDGQGGETMDFMTRVLQGPDGT